MQRDHSPSPDDRRRKAAAELETLASLVEHYSSTRVSPLLQPPMTEKPRRVRRAAA